MTYRITYEVGEGPTDQREIELLCGDDGVRVEWETTINRNTGSTGIIENVVQNTLRYVTFDAYFQESVFHKLESWMSYAQQGRPFAFTKDLTKSQITTDVSSNVVLNGTVINTSSSMVSAVVAGDYLYISDTFGTKWDIVPVTDVTAATIEIDEPISHAYTAGDTLISWYYYFPNLYLMDEKFDPDKDGSFWHHKFNCVEVRNVT
jgi:hypothetical protein